LLGKLEQASVNSVTTGPAPFISATVGDTHYSFLIDTGAPISLLPYNPTFASVIRPTAVTLSTATGTPIKCYGKLVAELGLRAVKRNFLWSFVVADVINPILGTDFLAKHGLLVDCKNKMLLDPLTNCKIPLKTSSDSFQTYSITATLPDPRAQALLSKYPVLTSPLQLSSNSTPCKIQHFIDTGDSPPRYFKARPLSGAKLAAAKTEFTFLLNAGIIQRSNSPWSSPLHLVPKDNGQDWRPCGDFRSLNSITVDDKYPIPNLRALTMSLNGKSIFTKLDLQRAYLQIPVAPQDIPKTAVCTPFGLFEFKYMPFGLKGAGATFQRFIDYLVRHT
jgi:hypothetical protein